MIEYVAGIVQGECEWARDPWRRSRPSANGPGRIPTMRRVSAGRRGSPQARPTPAETDGTPRPRRMHEPDAVSSDEMDGSLDASIDAAPGADGGGSSGAAGCRTRRLIRRRVISRHSRGRTVTLDAARRSAPMTRVEGDGRRRRGRVLNLDLPPRADRHASRTTWKPETPSQTGNILPGPSRLWSGFHPRVKEGFATLPTSGSI